MANYVKKEIHMDLLKKSLYDFKTTQQAKDFLCQLHDVLVNVEECLRQDHNTDYAKCSSYAIKNFFDSFEIVKLNEAATPYGNIDQLVKLKQPYQHYYNDLMDGKIHAAILRLSELISELHTYIKLM